MTRPPLTPAERADLRQKAELDLSSFVRVPNDYLLALLDEVERLEREVVELEEYCDHEGL